MWRRGDQPSLCSLASQQALPAGPQRPQAAGEAVAALTAGTLALRVCRLTSARAQLARSTPLSGEHSSSCSLLAMGPPQASSSASALQMQREQRQQRWREGGGRVLSRRFQLPHQAPAPAAAAPLPVIRRQRRRPAGAWRLLRLLRALTSSRSCRQRQPCTPAASRWRMRRPPLWQQLWQQRRCSLQGLGCGLQQSLGCAASWVPTVRSSCLLTPWRCCRLVGLWVGGQAGRQVAGAGQMPAENAGCCQPLWSCVVMLCLQAPGSPVGPVAAYNFLERFMLPGRKGSVVLPVWGNRASLPVVWHNCTHVEPPVCLSVCLALPACRWRPSAPAAAPAAQAFHHDQASAGTAGQSMHWDGLLLARCQARTPLRRIFSLLLQAHAGAAPVGAAAAAPGQAQHPPARRRQWLSSKREPMQPCRAASTLNWPPF